MKTMRHILMAGTVALFAPMATAYAAPPADTIVVGISADASTFDPAQISSRDNSNIASHIFGTLTEITPDGAIVPSLAASYIEAEDGLSITYTMQPDLTCEDGEVLNAEDVAYTFNRAADPANAFTGATPGFVFSSIAFKGAEAVSDSEVKINIGARNPIAVSLIGEVMIHCKDSYEKMSIEDASSKPVASGSYRLVTWDRASQVVLEKIKEPGTFNNIIYRIIPEASTRSAELIAGNVDIITNVAPDQLDAINSSGAAEVKSVQGTRRIYVGFNQKESFASTPGGAAIQKPEVRRAMQYAIDVPSICSQLLNFECVRATGLVNPPNDNKSLTPYPYDPDMAEKLLDEAGYPRDANGVRFTIKLQGPRGRYLNDANVEQALGQYLGDIGIETEVELMEFASVYVPLIQKHDAGPLFFLGSGGNLVTAEYDMTDIATPDSGTNYTGWQNQEWFDGWKKLETVTDPAERKVIIDAMQKVFYDDSPWLLLYFQPDFYGVSKRIAWDPRRDERVYLQGAALAQ